MKLFRPPGRKVHDTKRDRIATTRDKPKRNKIIAEIANSRMSVSSRVTRPPRGRRSWLSWICCSDDTSMDGTRLL
ncbi:hypothetical protein BDR06DRAFT_963496 [Suillus hirtellus]|nr:hypothetical protein BDR06DRAFT_963496 [Suillus hirtellus]